MSRHELQLQLPVGARIASGEDGFSQRCRDECAEMGVSRVRLLLLDADDARSTAWREEAQHWMDEQLRREGEWVLRGVIAGIVVLATCIGLAAITLW
ncbi:TPA: hypothetical protein HH295_04270 [Xanthomonas vasicola pv. zeae]|uniref:Uncharacterized protein n=2 Tax=Xanthomonas vasicola pv. vasculorum TaxID=325776 RepID=A0A836P3Q6_XANVA|nr:hypothetical protein [Xanthomonas vasicola]KFA16161.1 hypothetical protein KWS_0126855 [Xanthomonas vasicola pv. musacearum NCPPB 4384]AVQ08358.1 hypothetical protein C7V42_18895 [Xanthomonas vasicola pv. vasculorum]AZM72556.1 hypothetical protein CXP37_18910 [Xanthomonas vasicola pv. vasculorum]AZR28260.1 hypothetical protein NX80_019395 [Xanthomonas vasicola pv. arecae]AZR32512.1 hypothetical protein KWO_020470 [Xanthomonas vasicola pv. musacearum NCPPB 4379]